MSASALPMLIDVESLRERMKQTPAPVLLDASWYLPATKRDAKREYLDTHIEGARPFDIDEVADKRSGLPHMLPLAADFEAAAARLGIGAQTDVVVYDGAGIFSAPRVWWMFRVFGHERVSVLDGGIAAWKAAGFPTVGGAWDGKANVEGPPLRAKLQAERIANLEDIRARMQNTGELILDARGVGRFRGEEAEPRAGVRSGHIPGAQNLPYAKLLDTNEQFLSVPELKTQLLAMQNPDTKRITCSCGSGVTACILAFALEHSTQTIASVYDGSWSEWGGRSDTPVDTGA